MHYKIAVPVERHIKKFIKFYFPQEPIEVSPKGFIGVTLFSLLDKTMNHHPSTFRKPPEQLTFTINEFNFAYSGSELSPAKVSIFNSLLEDFFWEKFFGSVDLAIAVRPVVRERKTRVDEKKNGEYKRQYRRRVEVVERIPEIRVCLHKFLELHGMGEDDVSYDAVKKAYYRYRKGLEENKKKSKIFY